MEKKMENEMEAGIIQGLYYIIALEFCLGILWCPIRVRLYPPFGV